MSRIIYTAREMKRKKRLPWHRPWLLSMLGMGAVVAVSIYTLRYPGWQINDIQVSGNRTILSKDIESVIFREIAGGYASIIPRSSFFLTRGEAVGRVLKKNFPRISEVNIVRNFPNQIRVAIYERSAWAILCNDGLTPEENSDIQCVYIDSEGLALDEAPNSFGSLVVKIKTDFALLKVGEYVLEPARAIRIYSLGEKIEALLSAEIIAYEIFSVLPREMRMRTSEGFSLIVLLEDDPPEIIRVLKSVLEEEIKERRSRLDYIDLRFGNKVFFKFR
jgi:hypothetical protein